MVKRYEMPAGEYWICDPCYVIADDDWHSLLTVTGFLGTYEPNGLYCDARPNEEAYGVFEWKGYLLGSANTKYGDGGYPDQDGYQYSVDAGCIGAIPVELCEKDRYNEDLERLGRFVTFDEPFEFWSENGQIHIGDIVIETDWDNLREYYEVVEDDDES